MSGFGEKLKREREARKTSLEEISAATKISVRLLQAIEAEDFDRLPGGVFNVNFVRQYARHLHLDEEQVVSEFRALTVPPAEVQGQERPALPPEWGRLGNGEYDSGLTREPQMWKWATVTIAMLGTASAGYLWWTDRQAQRASEVASLSRPAPAVPKPAAQPPVVPAEPTAPGTAPAEGMPPESAPAAMAVTPPGVSAAAPTTTGTAPPALAATSPDAIPADAPVRVELHATDVVWVAASADGAPKFQTTLQPEQTRRVAAQSMVRLRVGNAGGLTVTLNGAAQPSIGPRGQVRTVVFTPTGMQVIMPPPEASPAGATSDGPTSGRGAGAQASAGQ